MLGHRVSVRRLVAVPNSARHENFGRRADRAHAEWLARDLRHGGVAVQGVLPRYVVSLCGERSGIQRGDRRYPRSVSNVLRGTRQRTVPSTLTWETPFFAFRHDPRAAAERRQCEIEMLGDTFNFDSAAGVFLAARTRGHEPSPTGRHGPGGGDVGVSWRSTNFGYLLIRPSKTSARLVGLVLDSLDPLRSFVST